MSVKAIDPSRLKLDDIIRFHLTGEECKVVETDIDGTISPWFLLTDAGKERLKITLRWPNGDRRTYPLGDGIWWHFRAA